MATEKEIALGLAILVLGWGGAGCNAIFGLAPTTLGDAGGGEMARDPDASSPPDADAGPAPDAAPTPPDADGDRSGGWDAPTSAGCTGSAGPAPVNIEGMFCIDSTQVTYSQYADFLAAAAVNPPTQLPDCLANESFVPATGQPAPGQNDDYPVAFVDFCDARAYCAWAGKRLCQGLPGNFGLGAPEDGERYYACSGGALGLAYAYGSSYSPAVCSTPNGPPAPVGSMKSCVSAAYPGLYDLSGNIGFWEEMCDPSYCRDSAPPGPFDANAFRCDVHNQDPRDVAATNLGIRCCSDVQQR
jgi:hypothetical protein